MYQPRYKTRSSDRPRSNQCNFCGIEGHFESECDLKSILDRIKDYEHRLLRGDNEPLADRSITSKKPQKISNQARKISWRTKLWTLV